MPLVSVIIAFYNSQQFLKESVLSILSQDYHNLELLLMDDCSTDLSATMAKQLMLQDNRIKYFCNHKNLGVAATRNRGIAMAQGKYIAILDSDDIALPHRIGTQVKFLQENPHVFLAGSYYRLINKKGKILKKVKLPTNWQTIQKQITHFCPVWNGSVMFLNDKNTFYRNKFIYASDYDLWLRLVLQEKKMVNMPMVLTYYRNNYNSISYQHKTKQKLFSLKAKEFYYQMLKTQKDDYDSFNPDSVLNYNLEESSLKFILRLEIFASFFTLNKNKLKKLCLQYFKHHGFFNNFIFN